jgi:hypothetical protein
MTYDSYDHFETTPRTRSSGFAWGDLPEVLPVLPCGELTLIRIRGEDPSRAWRHTVSSLIDDMIGNRVSVRYVPVDGTQSDDITNLYQRHQMSGRFDPIVDHDLYVSALRDNGGGYPYGCGIPTLYNIRQALVAEGVKAEQALLVLDHFQRARPFRAEGTRTYPSGVPIDEGDADVWRTESVHYFARDRAAAPTVLVWHDNRAARPEAFTALTHRARLVVEHSITDKDTDLIRVHIRRDLLDGWPSQ